MSHYELVNIQFMCNISHSAIKYLSQKVLYLSLCWHRDDQTGCLLKKKEKWVVVWPFSLQTVTSFFLESLPKLCVILRGCERSCWSWREPRVWSKAQQWIHLQADWGPSGVGIKHLYVFFSTVTQGVQMCCCPVLGQFFLWGRKRDP